MTTVLWFAVLLACPLMMMFMMRGMRGGHGEQTPERTSVPANKVSDDNRLAALEHEVAQLRATREHSEGGGR